MCRCEAPRREGQGDEGSEAHSMRSCGDKPVYDANYLLQCRSRDFQEGRQALGNDGTDGAFIHDPMLIGIAAGDV